MELILINSEKLKIMMSRDDMAEYDISCESADYKNTETRRAFWSILDRAKKSTGFDAASDKIYIQMYPSKEGGCEMYVTKLGFSEKDREAKSANDAEPQIYRFDTLETLLRVCAELDRLGYSRFGRSYTDRKGFFLCLESEAVKKSADRTAFLAEFGEKWDGDVFFTYANEYCTPICDNSAVGILSALK